MKLKFQGLNVSNKSVDKFDFELSENIDLSQVHTTFQTLYYLSDDSKKKLYVLDINQKKFVQMNNDFLNDEALQLISVCANTNFLWCLCSNKNINQFEILKYSADLLVERIETQISLNDRDTQDLHIVSSDINVYIFHNSSQGLLCLYELKSRSQIDKKLYEEEVKLNENALSTLPINQLLVKERVKQISCGKEHILILSESKKVYSLGIGTKGQLGHGKIENCFDEPILINSFENKIEAISAGGWHSGAIDENGSCFMWGWNSDGQIGVLNDDNVFITKPTKIILRDDLTSKEIKFRKLTLGSRHSALLDMNNNLYVFGWNKYKQLMLDLDEKESNIEEPLKCVQFDQNVIDVRCGSWFTLVKLN